MYNRIRLNTVFAMLTIFISTFFSQSYSQSNEDEYAVTAYINAGYSRFISELDYKNLNKINNLIHW